MPELPLRLLYDQNLSRRLVTTLDDVYPDAAQVTEMGHEGASDDFIWALAVRENRTIVTKDADFVGMSLRLGSPPKVIWLQVGNCPNRVIIDLLRANTPVVYTFAGDPYRRLLTLR